MKLPKNIKDEIWEYCRVNDISGVDDFIIKMVKQGFTSEKFGSMPWDKEPEIKEVEKIVEKEIIKEVEVIKEIIKEVPVEVIKEVKVTDNDELDIFVKEINDLKDVVHKKEQTINTLNAQVIELEVKRNEVSGLNLKIGRLNSEIERLSTELISTKNELEEVKNKLEEELKRPKQKEDDIYGEPKKGFFGSNVSDIWKKKKQ